MNEDDKSLYYGVEDVPSPHTCIIFAFQVCETMKK